MDDGLLYRIAYMYYQQGLSLEEIGKKLRSLYPQLERSDEAGGSAKSPRYTTATISRNLKRARQRRIVRFEFEPPRLAELETQLVEAYRLKDAVVVATPPVPDTDPLHRRQLGKAAANYVLARLPNGGHLGLCGGQTMAHLAQHLSSDRISALDIHALAASSYERIEYAASTVVGLAVLALKECSGPGAQIRGHGSLLPVTEAREASEAILKVRAAIDEARQKCQILVSGIGGLSRESSCVLRGQDEPLATTVQHLEALGAVGDLLYQLFDSRGVAVTCDLNDQVVGVRLADLPDMAGKGRLVVAVAGGKEKLAAIRAVLNAQSPFLGCLITDEDTAQALCPAGNHNRKGR